MARVSLRILIQVIAAQTRSKIARVDVQDATDWYEIKDERGNKCIQSCPKSNVHALRNQWGPPVRDQSQDETHVEYNKYGDQLALLLLERL